MCCSKKCWIGKKNKIIEVGQTNLYDKAAFNFVESIVMIEKEKITKMMMMMMKMTSVRIS
jgi:hypothetical protein